MFSAEKNRVKQREMKKKMKKKTSFCNDTHCAWSTVELHINGQLLILQCFLAGRQDESEALYEQKIPAFVSCSLCAGRWAHSARRNFNEAFALRKLRTDKGTESPCIF